MQISSDTQNDKTSLFYYAALLLWPVDFAFWNGLS